MESIKTKGSYQTTVTPWEDGHRPGAGQTAQQVGDCLLYPNILPSLTRTVLMVRW